MAREYTDDALQALVAALRNPRERVPAAVALLDRGWGKPKQTFEADGNSPLTLHLVAAQAVVAQVLDMRLEPQPQPIVETPRLLDAPPPTE